MPRSRRRCRQSVLPAAPAAAAQGPHHRDRRRQGFGRDGAGAGGALARPARRAGRHPLRPRRARASGSRSSRPRIPCPTQRGSTPRAASSSMVQGLSEDDLVIALISGGGSSLLPPARAGPDAGGQAGGQPGAAALRRAIGEMNCVRKHLSAIKGGRLAAAAYPARVVTLVISDVPGDDPSVIASGPTVAGPDHLRRCPRGPREIRHHRTRRGDAPSRARPRTRRPSPAIRGSRATRHAL